MIAIQQYSSKQTSVSYSTQLFKRGLVDGAKTAPDTATDEGIDAISVSSRGEGPPGTGSIYYFRNDDRTVDNL